MKHLITVIALLACAGCASTNVPQTTAQKSKTYNCTITNQYEMGSNAGGMVCTPTW